MVAFWMEDSMHLRNVVLAIVATAAVAFCQSRLDAPYQVRYAAHLDDPSVSSIINIINTGGNGSVPQFGPQFGNNGGNICVNIYALDPDEELISCCSCMVTPNQIVQLKVGEQILAQGTLTGYPVPSMTIKLVGSNGGTTNFTSTSCAKEAAQVLFNPALAHGIAGGFVAFGITAHTGKAGMVLT